MEDHGSSYVHKMFAVSLVEKLKETRLDTVRVITVEEKEEEEDISKSES